MPVHVNFDAHATIDTATAAAASVNEGGSVALDIVAGPFNATVSIFNLGTATLKPRHWNPDGSVTLTENHAQRADADGGDDDTANIHLTVVGEQFRRRSTDARTIDIAVIRWPKSRRWRYRHPTSSPILHLGHTPTVSVSEERHGCAHYHADFEAIRTPSTPSPSPGSPAPAPCSTTGVVNLDGSVRATIRLAGLTLTASDTQQVQSVQDVIQLSVTANVQRAQFRHQHGRTPQRGRCPDRGAGRRSPYRRTDRFKIIVSQSDPTRHWCRCRSTGS